MRTVSSTYAPYTDARHVDFTVRFELVDTAAKAAAVPSVSGQADVSQISQLTDDVSAIGKWATLEDDLWVLDGTYDILPDDVTGIQTGWWSDVLSGADGVFSVPPSITFGFGGASISTIGYTLFFAEDYPTSIRVTTYNGATIINQHTISNSKAFCVLDFPSAGYTSVKFEFLQISKPYRRVKLAEGVFGIVQIFDRENLVSANVVYGADITADAFPSRQLIFGFDNTDKKYNLVNPNGLYAYLQQGQDITATAIVNGEAVNMGKFEFLTASASDDEITAEIVASDLAMVLDTQIISGSNTTATLQSAVTTVLSGTGITASIATPNYTVSMAIPKNTTKREAIRMLAQAAKSSVWFDRDGVLQIRPITVGTPVGTLDADNMPSMGGISVAEPVDAVALTVKNEYASTEATYTAGSGTRVRTVDNPCVAAANGADVAAWLLAQYNRRVKYDKPNRGDPAVEIGDTLTIYDAYGENRNASVTGQEIQFDGGLSATTKAVG